MIKPVPKNSSAIKPGIKIHCIHPDWFISCKRLAETAIDGTIIGINRTNDAISNVVSDTPANPKKKPAIKKYTKQNRKKYQNSDLDALPLKLPYFSKHVLSDSVNPIT